MASKKQLLERIESLERLVGKSNDPLVDLDRIYSRLWGVATSDAGEDSGLFYELQELRVKVRELGEAVGLKYRTHEATSGWEKIKGTKKGKK